MALTVKQISKIYGTHRQDFRDGATDTIKKYKIPSDEFYIVGFNKYEQILVDILKHFTNYGKKNLNSFRWWNDLKSEFNDTHTAIRDDEGYKYFDRVINDQEFFWLIVLETKNERPKYWVCEGKIKPIQIILNEAVCNDFYLVSKKFEWMIGENPYGMLEVCGKFGKETIEKIRLLESKTEE